MIMLGVCAIADNGHHQAREQVGREFHNTQVRDTSANLKVDALTRGALSLSGGANITHQKGDAYICMGLFAVAAKQASRTASMYVGCACDIRDTSSADARNSIAVTPAAIISAARAPMMCIPRISSVFLSARTLTRPSTSIDARARPNALYGNEPVLY